MVHRRAWWCPHLWHRTDAGRDSQVYARRPALVSKPNPADRSIPDIEHVSTLSWKPKELAAQHDVYFGSEKFAVSAADSSDMTGAYRGRQDANNYIPPEALEMEQTFCWWIDEFNTDGTITTGKVWSFTVANFLIVDDMESYTNNEPDRIFDRWIDRWSVPENGSQAGYDDIPFAKQTIVHGGKNRHTWEYYHVC